MLAIGCALAALVSAALLAPAFAGAQAADDEYNLTLPGTSSGHSGDAGGRASAADTPGTSAGGQQAATSGGGGSDDGGAPIGLIALAVAAAGCAGIAVWQLRNRTRDGGQDGRGKVGPGATEATGETQ